MFYLNAFSFWQSYSTIVESTKRKKDSLRDKVSKKAIGGMADEF